MHPVPPARKGRPAPGPASPPASGSSRLAAHGALVVAVLAAACVESPAEPPVLTDGGDNPAEFSTGSADHATALAATPFGIYLAGSTAGSVAGESAGSWDGFVRRYDPEGDLIWEVQFGGRDADYVEDMAVDADGVVYVVGHTSGSLAGSRGWIDAFLRKYDPDGNELWTRQFGTQSRDVGTGVALDSTSGAIYVAGWTQGDLAWANPGSYDGFVRRYEADGTVAWTRQFGTSSGDDVQAIAVDFRGDVYVGGHSYGPIAGQPTFGALAYVRKYSSTGAHRWTRTLGSGPLNMQTTAIAINAAGQPIVAGNTEQWSTADGIGDVFVRRYSAAGDSLWTLRYPGQNGATFRIRDIAIDGPRVYVSGGTDASQGTRNAFLMEIKGDVVQWVRQYDSGELDESSAVTAFDGALYIAGYTHGAWAGSNAGAEDAFIARLTASGEAIWIDQ